MGRIVKNKVVTNAVTTTDGYLAGYTGSMPFYNEPIYGSRTTAINILKSHEDVMCNIISDISSIKEDMTNVYTYKGSVASAENLPTDASVGDVYDIQSASVYGSAGSNVAWTGTAWDSLGEIFSVDSITNTQIDEICV